MPRPPISDRHVGRRDVEHVGAERAPGLQLELIRPPRRAPRPPADAPRPARRRRTDRASPPMPAMLDEPNASSDVVDWPNARRLSSSDCVRRRLRVALERQRRAACSVPPMSTLMLSAPRDASSHLVFAGDLQRRIQVRTADEHRRAAPDLESLAEEVVFAAVGRHDAGERERLLLGVNRHRLVGVDLDVRFAVAHPGVVLDRRARRPCAGSRAAATARGRGRDPLAIAVSSTLNSAGSPAPIRCRPVGSGA